MVAACCSRCRGEVSRPGRGHAGALPACRPAGGGQPARAGARCRARPYRPSSGHRSARVKPYGRVRGRGDGTERVTQRRPGRLRQHRIGAADEAELEHRVLAHLLGPGAEPAQPAAHGRGRDAQPASDPPAPRPGQRHPSRSADDLDAVGPPRRAPRRQQDLGPPARAAARPLRAQSRCRAGQQANRPLPAVSPPLQPPGAAGRAGQRPARQVRGRSGGIGAQQHGRPSRSRQPRCPGQAHVRQGQLVLQPARSGRGPQPGTPHTPGNDIMTTIRPRPWSGDRHRADACSQCRRARNRTPAASPGSACSRRTTPTLFQVVRKNGAEHKSRPARPRAWHPGVPTPP